MRVAAAFMLLLPGCTHPASSMCDAGECAPDFAEPDELAALWVVASVERPELELPGTWTDELDRFKATFPSDLATIDGQLFIVSVDGALELELVATCTTGEWSACPGTLRSPQICALTGDGPLALELAGSCSFGAALLELDARGGTTCERTARLSAALRP